MTARPLLVDLYCCAGGAAVGYHRAGFDVVGVDIEPRPNYPFTFIEADALEFLRGMIAHNGLPAFYGVCDTAVAVHASPPCQERSTLKRGTNDSRGWGRRDHEQLVPPTRLLLDRLGLPYVIEQPQGHKGLIRTDLRLCMDMFRSGPPPWVQRHRDFEIHWFAVKQPTHPKGPVSGHDGYVRGIRHGVWRTGDAAPYIAAYGDGGGKGSVAEMQHALGIDWTSVREELTEAIPPAFTEHVGDALMAGLAATQPRAVAA